MRSKIRLITALVLVVALVVPVLSPTPALAASPPAYESSATNVNSNDSATSLTITKPTGTADGDLLVASVSHNEDNGTISGPAGWTEINQGTSGTHVSRRRGRLRPSAPTCARRYPARECGEDPTRRSVSVGRICNDRRSRLGRGRSHGGHQRQSVPCNGDVFGRW